jgi:hypothetical protein
MQIYSEILWKSQKVSILAFFEKTECIFAAGYLEMSQIVDFNCIFEGSLKKLADSVSATPVAPKSGFCDGVCMKGYYSTNVGIWREL